MNGSELYVEDLRRTRKESHEFLGILIFGEYKRKFTFFASEKTFSTFWFLVEFWKNRILIFYSTKKKTSSIKCLQLHLPKTLGWMVKAFCDFRRFLLNLWTSQHNTTKFLKFQEIDAKLCIFRKGCTLLEFSNISDNSLVITLDSLKQNKVSFPKNLDTFGLFITLLRKKNVMLFYHKFVSLKFWSCINY